MADRVVQAALKLVLEPIFEQDFRTCSYGFRPNRRTHDALAEIHHFGSRGYTWVLEGTSRHVRHHRPHRPAGAGAPAGRGQAGSGAGEGILQVGILTELGEQQETRTGTPQGGILSPLLSNIALSVLDDYYVEVWNSTMKDGNARYRRRQKGLPNWRLIRYADDWVVMVAGSEPTPTTCDW